MGLRRLVAPRELIAGWLLVAICCPWTRAAQQRGREKREFANPRVGASDTALSLLSARRLKLPVAFGCVDGSRDPRRDCSPETAQGHLSFHVTGHTRQSQPPVSVVLRK